MEGYITMTHKELDRFEVIKKARSKCLRIKEAAEILGLSVRQTQRLSKRLKELGPEGLISKKRGAPGNHALPKELKQKALQLIRAKYHDFGPTLAHEYLTEQEELKISVSTIRALMIENQLWIPNRKKQRRPHPMRARRARFGELVQIDGSDHDWFEGRAPRCTILAYIDDATSAILHLLFVNSESTLAYFEATRGYLQKYGRPLAFYSDKHSVFRVNHSNALSGTGATQFKRAMDELDIEQICANSPQAKGRVERRNRDLQNRLIKAMRLKKISTIQEANAFIPQFTDDFNKRFAKAPLESNNAHRPLLREHNLDMILAHKERRCLSKNLTLQYKNVIYQVLPQNSSYALKKTQVTVIESMQGQISIQYQGKSLRFITSEQDYRNSRVLSSKEVAVEPLQKRKQYHPPHNHPWKKWRPKHRRAG